MTESTQPDKFKATWISHSKINDFNNCPRLFYLRNIYKDPITRNKIALIEPPLALGQAVHEILEDLTNFPAEERIHLPLVKKFETDWDEKYAGKKGGFKTSVESDEAKQRGKSMIERVMKNPGPISNKAIKIKSDFADLPYYWLSEEENIILCGKIDWLEYLENEDKVHIVDFKTGRRDESEDSLQLPVYLLIATHTQSREVAKASYWYIDREDEPREYPLPDLEESRELVMKQAKRIKLATQLDHFKCPKGGCMHCSKYEEILAGNATKVGESSYQDVYVLV